VKGVEDSKTFHSNEFYMLWEPICRGDCKKLVKHYKILMHYVKQVMDLILVDEIGEKIAKSVLVFDNEENKIIITKITVY
jgi:DNA ligase (NAD+)